jgi:diguanylate cyclase (GGDEF)-like protein/PAS domain S-box-containing protein
MSRAVTQSTAHELTNSSSEAAVLVVDDTPDRLEFLELLLKKAGYRVIGARDGVEALELARRWRPLLIVSDVNMPRVGGIELSRTLRADPAFASTSILLVSALRVDDASAVEGLRAGADDYLEAPFDPMRLVAKAARLVERARFEAALRESEERYALAARGANDGLWDWDLNSGRVYYSARWCEMLGLGSAEMRGGSADWLSRVHPEDSPNLAGKIAALARGADTHLEVEHRVRHADGSYRWMLTRGTIVRDATGKALRMAGSMTDLTERKRLEEQLVHDAFHDALTGLPNRALFMDRLGRAVERAKRDEDCCFALLFLDLDRFKTINDSAGHQIGDHLLTQVATRLEACVRSGDTVARFGGDEFTVLLEGVNSADDAVKMADRVQDCLSPAFSLGCHELYTGASVGIAHSATGFASAEEMLRAANIALHRAKAEGRGRHRLFDAALHARASALLRLETDLRRAETREEYGVEYQPIISLTDGAVAGFEALVRWRHPERGVVYPGEFIPVAEETGRVTRIDRVVLTEACRQAMHWRNLAGVSARRLTMSVNLSAKSFLLPDLTEYVERTLQETGLSPEELHIEITESVLLSESEAVRVTLFRLREMGIALHLDDFGTGYSSLSYLRRFPISAIKIDRSFVQVVGPDGENSQIARAVITLAHSLGMEVVAEGIEERHQFGQLREWGCAYGQGHLFSKPLDPDRARRLLEEASAPPS